MASIRRLKKEADYLVSELVADCLSYISLYSKADKDKVFEVIREVLSVRNQVRDMANHPDGKDNPKLVKAHYKAATEKLARSIQEGYARLEKLTTT
ncbi:MAG: hypothetical protein RBS73_04525 [Prolixibacteraceae bacterium]|jgi:hypothetical protein|nr:hypothetical protein [Prolixibacteraceae bacterium]